MAETDHLEELQTSEWVLELELVKETLRPIPCGESSDKGFVSLLHEFEGLNSGHQA